MVVHDLDGPSLAISPGEADTPLIIDANAHLTGAIALQLFKTVAGRRPQIIEGLRGVKHLQLSARPPLDLRNGSLDLQTGEQRGGPLVGEALDHR